MWVKIWARVIVIVRLSVWLRVKVRDEVRVRVWVRVRLKDKVRVSVRGSLTY